MTEYGYLIGSDENILIVTILEVLSGQFSWEQCTLTGGVLKI